MPFAADLARREVVKTSRRRLVAGAESRSVSV